MLGIIIGVIVFIALIYFLSWLFGTGANLSDYSDATIETVIPGNKMNNATSVNYSFSIWLYISDWSGSYGKPKVVFSRDVAKPLVTLGALENSLTTTIKLQDGSTQPCVVQNIPIQKWTNILITVNDRALDTYMNGKLAKTCMLPSVPAAPSTGNSSVYLTPKGGFTGYTARFKYWANPVNPQEAWNVYKAGPGGNIVTNFLGLYKLQLNFIKGTETKASITI
jgi:hypothetical protein